MSSAAPILKNPVATSRRGTIAGLALRSAAAFIMIAAVVVDSRFLIWSAIAILLFIWLSSFIARAFCRAHFESLYELRRDSLDGEQPGGALPGVTVISPARNEEAGIEAAARSLAALDYPNVEAIVVNDHSTDGTREILERVQKEFPNLRVIHDPPAQEGWLGKANAIWFAVQNSDPNHKWLVLTDGDVVFDPKTIRRAVAHVEATKCDFFTCIPYLDNQSFAEELLLPNAWRDIIISSSLRLVNKPNGRPVGIGAFILVSRKAYLESGGHSAIANQQPEDTLLCAVVKKWGGVIGVGWTSEMLRVRLYHGYAQLRSFLVRKTRVSADDSVLSLTSRAIYAWILYVLPLVLGVCAVARQILHPPFTLPMTVYAISALGVYVDVARGGRQARKIAYMRNGIQWLHPLGGLLRFWLMLVAVGQIISGRPMNWRGRDFSNVRVERPPDQTES